MKTLFLICLSATVAVCFPVDTDPALEAPGQPTDDNGAIPSNGQQETNNQPGKDSSVSSESKEGDKSSNEPVIEESGNEPDQENTDKQISRVRRAATNVDGSAYSDSSDYLDCDDGSTEGSGSGSSEQVSIETSGNDYVEGSGDYDSSSGDQ
ncbi:hypothetical protein M3Y97_00751200 [Aphelenchoides bicaudatus]|nr:hypothetical protein M3Y97_00751200 [Aphelenchoides bicaudatus]